MIHQGSRCPSPASLIYSLLVFLMIPPGRGTVSSTQLRFPIFYTGCFFCLQQPLLPVSRSGGKDLPFPHAPPSPASGELGRHTSYHRGGKLCHRLSCGGFRQRWDGVPGWELSVSGSWEVGRTDQPFGQCTCAHVPLATSWWSR